MLKIERVKTNKYTLRLTQQVNLSNCNDDDLLKFPDRSFNLRGTLINLFKKEEFDK